MASRFLRDFDCKMKYKAFCIIAALYSPEQGQISHAIQESFTVVMCIHEIDGIVWSFGRSSALLILTQLI